MTDRNQNTTPEPDAGAVSRGRKIRLLGLLALLFLLAFIAALAYLHRKNEEAQERREIQQNIAALHQALQQMDLIRAEMRWSRLQEMAPENLQAAWLSVPLAYAGGRLDMAMKRFRQLTDARALPPADARNLEVLRALGGSLEEALRGESRALLGTPDVDFLRTRGWLWRVAQRLTAGTESQRQKALLLCRWFALHMRPGDEAGLAVGPELVLWRRYGSAPQLAWTYAELALQADLPCRVVIGPDVDGTEAILVEVTPADTPPFLVDPYRGVPVTDTNGALLALRDLPAEAGVAEPYDGLSPDAVTARVAVHPFMIFPPALGLEKLLAVLPQHPHVCLLADLLPDGEPDPIWALPVQTHMSLQEPAHLENLQKQHQPIATVGSLFELLLMAPGPGVEEAALDAAVQLEQAADDTEVAETRRIVADALQNLLFVRAANAHETGDYERAEQLLTQYLEDYPAGTWQLTVRVLLADSLAAQARSDAALAIWRDLPPPRRHYGALRAAQMLPLVSAPAAPVSAPAQPAAPLTAPTSP